MRLGGKVLEEERFHRALEADMQFADLAFGQGNDRNAHERQMIEQRRHVGLIAANPVQRLGQHRVELARLRVPQHGLDTGRRIMLDPEMPASL